jgi:hypothetical protein
VLLPLPGRLVQTFCGGLDLIEAHLDWLDGDRERVNAYVAHENAEREARLKAEQEAEADRRRWWDSMPRPVMDDRDRELLAGRVRLREARSGPRTGDFVILPEDAEPVRLTGPVGLNSITTTWPGSTADRFYLARDGRVSHSGGNRFVKHVSGTDLVDAGPARPGAFWFFHHDILAPKGGIHVDLPCRVYQVDRSGT